MWDIRTPCLTPLLVYVTVADLGAGARGLRPPPLQTNAPPGCIETPQNPISAPPDFKSWIHPFVRAKF